MDFTNLNNSMNYVTGRYGSETKPEFVQNIIPGFIYAVSNANIDEKTKEQTFEYITDSCKYMLDANEKQLEIISEMISSVKNTKTTEQIQSSYRI